MGKIDLGPVRFQVGPHRRLLDPLFLAGELVLAEGVVLDMGMFQAELGPFDLIAGPLQHDGLGLFVHVAGFVHLLELTEFLLFVFEHVLIHLQHEVSRFQGQAALHVVELFQVLLGDAVVPLGGFQVQGSRFFHRLERLFGLLERQVGDLHVLLLVGDGAIDLLSVQGHEQLASLDLGAVFDCLEHAESGPLLRPQADSLEFWASKTPSRLTSMRNRPFLTLAVVGLEPVASFDAASFTAFLEASGLDAASFFSASLSGCPAAWFFLVSLATAELGHR